MKKFILELAEKLNISCELIESAILEVVDDSGRSREYFPENKHELQEKIYMMDWESDIKKWSWLQAKDIAVYFGIENPNVSQLRYISSKIKSLNGERQRKSNGKKVLFVPIEK